MNGTHHTHGIAPVCSPAAHTLILGSFPSEKSRSEGFFYAHPQNRFWRVMAALTHSAVPETKDEKVRLLCENGFALWDVIESCVVTGSSDASIRDVVPNDIKSLVAASGVSRVFANGALAYKLYVRYVESSTGISAVKLPSTSPANASYSLEKLIEVWKNDIY